MIIEQNMTIQGSLHIIKNPGTSNQEELKFKNLITTNGLSKLLIGFNSEELKLSLGSGTSIPTIHDIGLTQLVSTINHTSSTSRVDVKSDGLGYTRVTTHLFTLDGSTLSKNENFTELGLVHQLSDTSTLLTKARIKDLLGNPSSISVTRSDTLYVYYTLEYNVDYVDKSMDLKIPVNGTESKDYKVKVVRNNHYFNLNLHHIWNFTTYNSTNSGMSLSVINNYDDDMDFTKLTSFTKNTSYLNDTYLGENRNIPPRILTDKGKNYIQFGLFINSTHIKNLSKDRSVNSALMIHPYVRNTTNYFNSFIIIITSKDSNQLPIMDEGLGLLLEFRIDVSATYESLKTQEV